MNLSLSGKMALVCGSTGGIGKACAMELAALGAKIILLARNEEILKETLKALPHPENQHDYLVADFSKPEQVQSVVSDFIQKGNALHILINNTGGPAPGPAHLAKPEEFLLAFQAHLINNHNLMQLCLPSMKEAGYGRIINIISTSVKIPLPNLGVSNTIRGAVGNWAKTLANELAGFGITVNNVLPGATATERLTGIIKNKATKLNISEEAARDEMLAEIPAKRFAQPEEIAYAAAFLASPAAAYINGINVPVDGGRTGNL